jgi:5-hydroxyisourate hydrolase-like protein (transthyretin family)
VDADVISHNIVELDSAWKDFMNEQKNKRTVMKRAYIDRETGEAKVLFREGDYFRGSKFQRAVASFFGHPLGVRPVVDGYVNPD